MSLVQNIKSKLRNNQKILESFSYLTLIQIFNLVLPLITYPYLVRVLGAEIYGSLIFAQAIIGYFSVIINFGFNISATKDIAANRGSVTKLSEITSSVLILQSLLWLGCLFLFIFALYLIPLSYNEKLLLLLTFGMTFNELLFPVWFFQGIEKMKFITYINLFTKIIFLCLVFLFIKEQTDFLLVPIFYILIYIICGIISFSIILIKYKVKIKLYSLSIIFSYFNSSFYLFLSKLALLIKDKSVIVILGILFSKSIVAYYDLAMKLINIFTGLYQSIPTAILPRLMQEKNYKLARFLFVFTIIVSTCYYFFLLIFSTLIIKILAGSSFLDAKYYLAVVGLVLLVNPLNTLLNYFFILQNQERLVLTSVLISFVVFCIMLLIGFIIDDINILLFSMSLSGLCETIYKLILFRKDKVLWRFIRG